MEIWKIVDNYPNYLVSNTGCIKSINHFVEHKNGRHRIQKGRVLKPSKCRKGYLRIKLKNNQGFRNFAVHRLVAKAFILNTEINSPVKEPSRALPQVQSQNQSSIANALKGSAELRETLIATLNKLTSASTESEKKSAIEIAKAVSQVGKEVNELLKTGVRAVEVMNKI